MTPIRLGAAAGAALAAALLAGCGVPTYTEVRVDGPVAEVETTESGVAAQPPPGPDEARNEQQLVEYFLQAAAADPGDAVERLRPFIHSDQRDAWEPEPDVVVVRVEDVVHTDAVDEVQFHVDVRQVGVLVNGVIEPRLQEQERFSFAVRRDLVGVDPGLDSGRARLRIVNPPDVIMLDQDALKRYFHPRPVYFWDTDHQVLVPDLRWLPRTQTEAARPQTMLDWLLAGPSPWLGSVTGLPDGVDQVGRVRVADGRLLVELSAPAGELHHDDLDAQLWWTLEPELSADRTLTVVIDGKSREVTEPARPHNLTTREPSRVFAVVGGEVRPYPAADSTEIPALHEDVNTHVRSAALSQAGGLAALVRAEEDGTLRLYLRGPDWVTATDLRRAQTMSRPVWLREPSGTGLVVADGRLYRFHAGDENVVQLPLAPLAGEITAVAAAPDGRRLALIAGDTLYMASIRRDDETITVHPPRALPTTAANLAGVAFSRPDRLAVVGAADDRFYLYEITVDGGFEERLDPYLAAATQTIRNVAAHPRNVTTDRPGEIMYEMDGRAYSYLGEPEPITAADFAVDVPEGEAPEPSAPFFLE